MKEIALNFLKKCLDKRAHFNGGFHETKQGVRFTISEEGQREILQRLLKLNHDHYEEEVAQGLHDKKKKKTSTSHKKKTSPAKNDGNMDLFDFMNSSPKGSK